MLSSTKINRNHIRGKKKQSLQMNPVIRKRIFFITILAGICIVCFLLFRFIQAQVAELRSLRFSDDNQSGFTEDFLNSRYTANEVFTLLIASEEESNDREVLQGFVLIRLDMNSHQADVMTVYPDLSIPLQHIPGLPATDLNLSVSRVRDLPVIGELQVEPIPLAYPLYQIEELYAIPIDGYIMFPSSIAGTSGEFSKSSAKMPAKEDGEGFQSWSEDWAEYWVDYLRDLSVVRIWLNRDSVSLIQSNMNVVDLYSFAHDLGSLPEDAIALHILEDEQVSEVIDERGEHVQMVSISAIDEILVELGQDERMEREQGRIEIFNGTNTDGWGSRYERWIKHLGGEIIRVKNAPQQEDGTVIYVTDQEKYDYTVRRISSLWEDVAIVEGRPDFITTGDIIIVLGE